MSALIILGNTNQFTFANSIIAAYSKAVELFKEPVQNIFVIHTADSYKILHGIDDTDQPPHVTSSTSPVKWMNYLQENNVDIKILVHRTVELDTTSNQLKILYNT